jgi:uncharacterized lipoprotein YajG
MRQVFAIPAIALLAGCASQNSAVQDPIWASQKIDGLQRSPCNCGGVESEEANEQREKAKKHSAEAGSLNTDIEQGPY